MRVLHTIVTPLLSVLAEVQSGRLGRENPQPFVKTCRFVTNSRLYGGFIRRNLDRVEPSRPSSSCSGESGAFRNNAIGLASPIARRREPPLSGSFQQACRSPESIRMTTAFFMLFNTTMRPSGVRATRGCDFSLTTPQSVGGLGNPGRTWP